MRCCDLPKGDYQSESPKVQPQPQPHLLAQSDIYLGNKNLEIYNYHEVKMLNIKIAKTH
jgi:hypothetical protein